MGGSARSAFTPLGSTPTTFSASRSAPRPRSGQVLAGTLRPHRGRWLAAIGIGADLRGFLGRWAAQGSADSYARVAVRTVENLQRTAAKLAREIWAGGPDYFGEEHTLMELDEFMLKGGTTAEQAENQRWRLTSANFQLDIELNAGAPKQTVPSPQAEDDHNDNHIDEDKTPAEATGVATPTEVWSSEDEQEKIVLQSADLEEDSAGPADLALCRALREEACEAAPTSGFIVSITDKGRMRRLHFLGACGRRPGEHYRDWRHYGECPPRADEVDARCRVCFPPNTAAAPSNKLPDDIDSDDESDTSSSTSSSAASERITQAAKRPRAD